MSLVVNLFAGPGAGKSTLAAGLFYYLKSSGHYTAELTGEFAKDLTWEGAYSVLANYPPYIFGQQYYRIARLVGQVDCVICDSPLPLSLCYGKEQPPSRRPFVMDTFNSFDNYNFFIQRMKPYEQGGRSQDEAEARKLDSKIMYVLWENSIEFDCINGDEQGLLRLCHKVHHALDDIHGNNNAAPKCHIYGLKYEKGSTPNLSR